MKPSKVNTVKRNIEGLQQRMPSEPDLSADTIETAEEDYLRYCFRSAADDLNKGNIVEGEGFLQKL